MKIKIIKMILLLGTSVISLTAAIISELKSFPVVPMLGSLFAGISIPYFIPSVIDLTDNENWKSSYRKLKRAKILQKDTFVRISFAYLFRIKVDGKYFLVKNTRTGKYQPVGGAYKFMNEEAEYLSENIPVENDDRIPVDKITKQDYRLLVKSKYLKKFVRRFDKTKNRENIQNLSREFIEEIFSTGILNKNKFGILSYKYCGRHMTNVENSNIFKHFELLLADIVEVCLSEEQKELFRNLVQIGSEKYYFATADEIKSLGVSIETKNFKDNIANHTFKILSENTDKLIMKNKHKNIVKIQL